MAAINTIIVCIMLGLMAIAGLDRCFGNKLGLGEKFEEGFMAMGALALSMVGAICIAPVLGTWLEPYIGPLYQALGANPAMFATTLLANDMGGYSLAMELSGAMAPNAGVEAINAGNFAGLILGAMMGPTIVFSIPLALGIIRVEDRPFLAQGILIGIIVVPIGCLAGGLVAKFPFLWMVKNLIPVIIVAVLITIGLKVIPNLMITAFLWFGKFVIAFLTVALIIAGATAALQNVEVLQAWQPLFPALKDMKPVSVAFDTVGNIAVILAGAFTLVHLLTKFFGKALAKVGSLLGMGEVAAAGMVATLANNIAMFSIMKDMDDRGKVINVAFAVCAAFVFGDHLGFTASMNKDMILPMVVGKLVGGIAAVTLAVFMAPKSTVASLEASAKAASDV